MQVETWIEQRETPGTLAYTARQLLEKDVSYRAAGKALRQMYFLELVLRHGGNQSQAARSIGVKQESVNRELRSLGIRKAHLERLADRLKESQ